jgi:hypothetical protein
MVIKHFIFPLPTQRLQTVAPAPSLEVREITQSIAPLGSLSANKIILLTFIVVRAHVLTVFSGCIEGLGRIIHFFCSALIVI